jgi:hypothetical protein
MIFEKILRSAPAFDTRILDTLPYPYLTTEFALGVMGTRQVNPDRFKARFREEYAMDKNKAAEKLGKEALNYYIFSSTRLGWINCDRFWDTNDEKINFAVNVPDAANTKVQIIFPGINSIMDGVPENGRFVFNNIPAGRNIKIVGISFTNGKPTMSLLNSTVNKAGATLTAFNAFTLDELDAILTGNNH